MRLVVKIGSSSLVDAQGVIDQQRLAHLADDVAAARAADCSVVLVSSGAIAAGLGVLGRSKRPRELPALQAASAVGQGAMFAGWSAAFSRHGVRCAQVLLTMHDVTHRVAYLNARHTLEQLLAWKVVPIVNENDTVATDEITFGDNDALAAQVAVQLRAERLLLLTDTDGLYDRNPSEPGAQKIEVVDDHSLLAQIDVAARGSEWGSGGMRSKVVAAEMASLGGTATFIADSTQPGVVAAVAGGAHVGTMFPADERPGSSFKLWLRYAKQPQGTLFVDSGARKAVVERRTSLLPVGIVGVEGLFAPGDAVMLAEGEEEFAKGIVSYAAGELREAVDAGQPRQGMDVAVHRDQLVVLERA